MSTSPAIHEVRPGLFLVKLTEKEIDNEEQVFHLRKSDYYPYMLIFKRPENGEGDSVMFSVVKSFSSNVKTLPVDSSNLALERLNLFSKNNEDELPLYIWVLQEGVQDQAIHLKLNNSNKILLPKRTWGPVCCTGKSLDLWLDFGTDTVGERSTLNRWARLLMQQNHTDVEFNVQGEPMGAHAPIVATSSPILASMLLSRTQEAKPMKVVRIRDIEPQVFEQLLHFVYSGRAPLLDEQGMAAKLFKAAEKYGLTCLAEECAHRMLHDLTIDNVVDTLVLTRHVKSLSSVYSGTLDFIMTHHAEISSREDWKKLLASNPELRMKISQLELDSTGRGI